jgi:hypothetical protein
MVANNQRFWVCGVGIIKIWCVINGKWERRSLSQVLYMLKLKKNLFSIGQVANRGFVATYLWEGCHPTSQDRHEKIVLIEIRTSKFYELQLEVEMPTNHVNITMFKGSPTPTQIEGGVVA